MSYRIAPLGSHDRSNFDSGSNALDVYFRERVSQDVRRRVVTCLVALDDADRIAGFYTVAATSLAIDRLAPDEVRRLPPYPAIPAILLGRLAVSVTHRGNKLGGAMVADAILRARQSEIMAYALVVDAKDETAAGFYRHLGFSLLAGGQLIRPL